jgi:2-polyprenyl-3-methyl-5-hydroxy-6-metoxy-1,4-benzoquinol methylase
MQIAENLAPPAPLQRVYSFRTVEACNMCGADAAQARVLGMRLDKSQGRQPRGKTGVAVSVCRCRCGLVFANPQPVPRSIGDHYGLPPESYWRSVSLEIPPDYFAWQIAAAKRLLDFKPGMRALDVGVGLGKVSRVMRDAGFDVYGIEPSEPFHAKALEVLGGDGERFKLATVESAEFAPASFDFVTFGAVLEHLYDPSAALAKAVRWLRPGGMIHAEIPNADHLVAKLINGYYALIGTSYVTNTSPMHVPYHLYEFTTESFRRNGMRNGYDLVEHRIEVASIYNIPRVLHPILRKLMASNGTGMQLTVWLRKRHA